MTHVVCSRAYLCVGIRISVVGRMLSWGTHSFGCSHSRPLRQPGSGGEARFGRCFSSSNAVVGMAHCISFAGYRDRTLCSCAPARKLLFQVITSISIVTAPPPIPCEEPQALSNSKGEIGRERIFSEALHSLHPIRVILISCTCNHITRSAGG